MKNWDDKFHIILLEYSKSTNSRLNHPTKINIQNMTHHTWVEK